MYAQTSARPPAADTVARPSRAALQTRPMIQRAAIRSWEYVPPVRATLLGIRLLVVMWLFFLTVMMVSNDIAWGWLLAPTAVAVLAIALWVYYTAAKGWPTADA